MSDEAVTITRRWSGYVCPACRFVFKVPVGHDGRGVVCPACRRLLRLPAAGEAAEPLVQAPAGEGTAQAGPTGGRQHFRHGAQQDAQANLDWERADLRPAVGERTVWRDFLRVAGTLVFIAILAMASLSWIGGWLGNRQKAGAVSGVEMPVDQGPGAKPVTGAGAGRETEGALVLSEDEKKDRLVASALKMDPGETLTAAGEHARHFLAATTVEEMLPLVRSRTRTEQRLRDWYRGRPVPKASIREFGSSVGFSSAGSLVVVTIGMDDFTVREMALERTSDGFLIDWESWVGWSEMSWEDYVKQKPAEGKEFRVMAERAEYYNFEFADDTKHQCYLLLAPGQGEERILYGYAERDSRQDKELAVGCGQGRVPFVLELAFPPQAKTANQVIIRKVLATGWVLDDAASGDGK